MPAHRRKDYDEPAFRAAWMDPRLTLSDIGERYDASPSSIYGAAMTRGLPARRALPARTVYDSDRFKAMWHDPDISSRKIAALFGVTPPAVSLAAKRRGWPSKYHVRAGCV